MADTTLDMKITTEPQSVSSLGGPAAGVAVRIVNNGHTDIKYAIAATLPDRNISGSRPMPALGCCRVVEFASGENDIYLWASIGSSSINVELA